MKSIEFNYAYFRTDRRIKAKVNQLPLGEQLSLSNQRRSPIQENFPELAAALKAGLTEAKSIG